MCVHKQKCPTCDQTGIRLDRYDAYVCKACDVWLEDPCLDPDCPYCSVRKGLEKPSQAPAEVWDDRWNT